MYACLPSLLEGGGRSSALQITALFSNQGPATILVYAPFGARTVHVYKILKTLIRIDFRRTRNVPEASLFSLLVCETCQPGSPSQGPNHHLNRTAYVTVFGESETWLVKYIRSRSNLSHEVLEILMTGSVLSCDAIRSPDVQRYFCPVLKEL